MSKNKFISLCGNKLLEFILEECKESIYYGIVADATPYISHKEQNLLILRYVSQNKENLKLRGDSMNS
jgi:hypothetical protein